MCRDPCLSAEAGTLGRRGQKNKSEHYAAPCKVKITSVSFVRRNHQDAAPRGGRDGRGKLVRLSSSFGRAVRLCPFFPASHHQGTAAVVADVCALRHARCSLALPTTRCCPSGPFLTPSLCSRPSFPLARPGACSESWPVGEETGKNKTKPICKESGNLDTASQRSRGPIGCICGDGGKIN